MSDVGAATAATKGDAPATSVASKLATGSGILGGAFAALDMFGAFKDLFDIIGFAFPATFGELANAALYYWSHATTTFASALIAIGLPQIGKIDTVFIAFLIFSTLSIASSLRPTSTVVIRPKLPYIFWFLIGFSLLIALFAMNGLTKQYATIDSEVGETAPVHQYLYTIYRETTGVPQMLAGRFGNYYITQFLNQFLFYAAAGMATVGAGLIAGFFVGRLPSAKAMARRAWLIIGLMLVFLVVDQIAEKLGDASLTAQTDSTVQPDAASPSPETNSEWSDRGRMPAN